MNAADVLIAPVVSEKSYSGLADRKYTFKVHQDAHKTQVRQAVEQLFGVKVQSVHMIKVAAKPKRRGVYVALPVARGACYAAGMERAVVAALRDQAGPGGLQECARL